MLGVRPQLMHNANLAFAASELLFNNLPVLPLHFIFGALFGVQYTSQGRRQGGAAFGPAGLSGGLSQRQSVPQAAPGPMASLGQSAAGAALLPKPYRPCLHVGMLLSWW